MKSRRFYWLLLAMLAVTTEGCWLVGPGKEQIETLEKNLEVTKSMSRELELLRREAEQKAKALNDQAQKLADKGLIEEAAKKDQEAAEIQLVADGYTSKIDELAKAERRINDELEKTKIEAEKSDTVNGWLTSLLGLGGLGSAAVIWNRIRGFLQNVRKKDDFSLATIRAIDQFREELPPEQKEKFKLLLQNAHKSHGVSDFAKQLVNATRS